MEFSGLFKSLSDPQRLRIVGALGVGPLCVCHIEEILDADQVRVSKQLRYLKEQGVVVSERKAQWMVYRLAEPDNAVIASIFTTLEADDEMGPVLAADRRTRNAILERITCGDEDSLGFLASSEDIGEEPKEDASTFVESEEINLRYL